MTEGLRVPAPFIRHGRLGPAIHVFCCAAENVVDGRNTCGHDEHKFMAACQIDSPLDMVPWIKSQQNDKTLTAGSNE